MQQKQQVRPSSGAKAIALDKRAVLLRYRLLYLQLLALLLSVGVALALHLIFGR